VVGGNAFGDVLVDSLGHDSLREENRC
jgi:hypothetical protein